MATNDSTNNNLILRFTAEAGGYPDTAFPLIITPQDMDFTPVEGKQRTKMATLIQNVGNKKLKIIPAGYSEDLFKIKLSDSDLKPGEKTKLMVKLNRHADLETFDKSVTFEINDGNKTRFSIPLKKTLSTTKTMQKRTVKNAKR